jgi:hypothetical protein
MAQGGGHVVRPPTALSRIMSAEASTAGAYAVQGSLDLRFSGRTYPQLA